jgi:hypothetical protein
LNDYLDEARHAADTEGPLFRPVRNNRTSDLDKTITPDGVYKLVRRYALSLGLKIGAHALRATAATNALDHNADIAKVQEWLGHANIATTRIYDRRKMKPEDSPTFKVSYRKKQRHNSCSKAPTKPGTFVMNTPLFFRLSNANLLQSSVRRLIRRQIPSVLTATSKGLDISLILAPRPHSPDRTTIHPHYPHRRKSSATHHTAYVPAATSLTKTAPPF